MTELLFLVVGIFVGAIAAAALPSKYTWPLFRLSDRIRGWLKFTPKG